MPSGGCIVVPLTLWLKMEFLFEGRKGCCLRVGSDKG